MKKPFLILLLIIFLVPMLSAQTAGMLDVSVSTSHAGGNYKPKNILAIWIEDDQGNFIKTLLARANKRKTHLNTWQASTTAAGTEYNTTDAITGATLSSHGTRTCTWDGTDYMGEMMQDGNYYLWMELTDKNSTGNYSSFVFEKGTSEVILNPDNEDSFSNIQFSWTPDQSSGVDQLVKSSMPIVRVNPVKDKLELMEMPGCVYHIIGYHGKSVYSGQDKTVDVQSLQQGLYFILFEDGRQSRFVKL